MSWHFRWILDPDGTCYLDIAKAYLRADWPMAINSYWSPLFSWLIAACFGVLHPQPISEIPILHGLILGAFVAGMAAWEWLFREWERWQGPPAMPILMEFAGYASLLWSGVALRALALSTPDILLLPIFLSVSALLVRIRAGRGGMREALAFGGVLGLGFLAKAAFVAAIPLALLALASSCGGWRDKRTAAAAVALLLVAGPFVGLMSAAKGHPTLGDAGWLNYSWVVDGYSVPGYKLGVVAQPTDLPHPARVVRERPLLLSYDEHPLGTIPAHFDPA
jgi:hypothetical protein